MGIWPRPAVEAPDAEAADIDLSEVSLFDLIDVFRGALTGVYAPGPPASCGTGATTVMGQFGPDSARDVGMLTVSDDGDGMDAETAARLQQIIAM